MVIPSKQHLKSKINGFNLDQCLTIFFSLFAPYWAGEKNLALNIQYCKYKNKTVFRHIAK